VAGVVDLFPLVGWQALAWLAVLGVALRIPRTRSSTQTVSTAPVRKAWSDPSTTA